MDSSTLEHLLNPRVRDIQISGIRRFANRVAQIPDAISLTIGQPDFFTPEHVKEAGKRAIDENKTTYTPNAGWLALREAASQFLREKYGLSYDPEEEIIVTIGASEALQVALSTILSEGCEVLLPGPVYPAYEPLIRLNGAVPVYIDTRQHGFRLNAEMISRHLTAKTRCLILPYPSNPTGCVLEKKELKEIADCLRERDVFVLSDEIYSELVYEGQHDSIAADPVMHNKTIVINGLSKSHAMTGWRIGFTFAPAYITRQMLKVHQYNVSCASSISQMAALEALTKGIDDAEEMRQEYRARRDFLAEGLQSLGFELVKPRGAFYLFPSIKRWHLSSQEFAVRLLEEEKVAVVPGDAFSIYGEGYIRLSYACSRETLAQALERMERFVRRLARG